MSLLAAITPDQSSLPAVLQNNILPIIGIVAIIGIGFLMIISVRGKVSRRNSARPSPREMIEQIKSRGLQRSESSASSADMVQATQRLAAQLDNKAAKLEVLIKHADERIAVLNKLHSKAAPPKQAKPQAEFKKPPSPRPHLQMDNQRRASPQTMDPLTRSVYNLADYGRSSLEIAQELDEQVGKVELILSLRDR